MFGFVVRFQKDITSAYRPSC